MPGTAYGLQIHGIGPTPALLGPQGGYPALRIRQEPLCGERPPGRITEEQATLRMIDGSYASVDRWGATAVFYTVQDLSDDDLVHPFLAGPAMVFSHWLSRQTFHCGAFVAGGRVWAMLGDKEAGKSTLLGWMALNDGTVYTDDLLVVAGTTAYAGPRCIDLRGPAADHLEAKGQVVRAGDRMRVLLGQVPPELPMGGWIYLKWADEPSIAPLHPQARVQALASHRAVRLPPKDSASMLDLARLPAWEFARPPDWESLADVAAELVALVSD